MVAECVGEGDGVDEGAVAVGKDRDFDGTLGVVERVGDGAGLVDAALAEEAAFDAHVGGVVVLVEDAVDDGYFAPGGVWGEVDFAGGKEQRGCEENKGCEVKGGWFMFHCVIFRLLRFRR